MRIPERTDSLCELGRATLPAVHIAQINEERHGGVVVDRTCRADECADPLPRLTFPPGQAGQVSLPGGLLFSLAPFTFASLTVASGFAPFLRRCLRSGTQFADRT